MAMVRLFSLATSISFASLSGGMGLGGYNDNITHKAELVSVLSPFGLFLKIYAEYCHEGAGCVKD
jgi:hypothetical protein